MVRIAVVALVMKSMKIFAGPSCQQKLSTESICLSDQIISAQGPGEGASFHVKCGRSGHDSSPSWDTPQGATCALFSCRLFTGGLSNYDNIWKNNLTPLLKNISGSAVLHLGRRQVGSLLHVFKQELYRDKGETPCCRDKLDLSGLWFGNLNRGTPSHMEHLHYPGHPHRAGRDDTKPPMDGSDTLRCPKGTGPLCSGTQVLPTLLPHQRWGVTQICNALDK